MSAWWVAQPAALWALLAVPLLWWRLRSGKRGELHWTGALAIWRRAVQGASHSDSRESHSVPLSAMAALLALVLGILALANPQRGGTRAALTRWTLVLDRSPSMFLPAQPTPSRPTRLERAVELAVACCNRSAVAPDAREWTSYAFDGLHVARGERPPPEWLDSGWGPGAPTPWPQLDLQGHVWVSDCEPQFRPLRAGRVHCGTSAIPGAIADLGPRCLVWDGQKLSEQSWASVRPGVFVAEGLPGDIAGFAKLWADERHLVGVSEPGAACLRITRADTTSAAPDVEGQLLGDGWSVAARANPSRAFQDLSTWAEFEDRAGRRSPAVQWRPGEIHIGLSSIAADDADPAVFALAWLALFDGARLQDPALVSLDERARTGPEIVDPPAAVAGENVGDVQSFAPWLAALAGALALLALVLSSAGHAARRSAWNPFATHVRSPGRVGLG